ncbi:hypothetical protein [Nocardioides speluncae]|uniref:hypothetical protein n=1 Tax=Nocardioides speluncae TaxID=2670337 RepID=UPI000D68E30D|nr:hypothetical protein [Nocardioides speluncae]
MAEIRKGRAAVDWAKGQVTNPTPTAPAGPTWFGWCLVFARRAFNVGPLYASAEDGWHAAEFRHGTTSTPPLGVPVWWTNGRHGHVAVSSGDGNCYSTDILRTGKVDKVAISFITRKWGQRYRGWTEDINGVRIWRPGAPNMPAVDLGKVREAAERDQFRPQGEGLHESDVLIVEKALRKEGLRSAAFVDGYAGTEFRKAYGKWQKQTVPPPFDGVPGIESLRKLGRANGFRVVQ